MKYEEGMEYKDFHGLAEIRINGKTYVDKEELLDLITTEQKRYKAGTEAGYLNLKPKQKLSVELALNHLKVLINKPFYEKLHEDIGKYVIVSGNDGNLVYLRGWCNHVADREGKETPVFSELPGDAVRFGDIVEAWETISALREEFPKLDLLPARAIWPRQKHGLQIIHDMLGWPEEKDPEEVMREELKLARELD